LKFKAYTTSQPLTNEDDEVRELTDADLKRSKRGRETLPETLLRKLKKEGGRFGGG
jgi:hypothetical protein